MNANSRAGDRSYGDEFVQAQGAEHGLHILDKVSNHNGEAGIREKSATKRAGTCNISLLDPEISEK